MGLVLEAERIGLGRRYAVKLLLAEALTEPSAVDRFRREAQVLAKLSSLHLVSVHDLDVTPDGRPYLIMDLLRGRDLRVVLREHGGGGIPVGDALRYAREALTGLAVAHAGGVVHRDVKLDNLFLAEPEGGGDAVVKVVDFGIAKAIAATREQAGDELQTASGIIVGTPKYASPEQIKGEPIDERADIYAMGLVLYELLTGASPFEHLVKGQQGPARAAALYRANLFEKPSAPSAQLGTPLPPGLDEAVLKALEKAPAARWPSARAFAEALAAVDGVTFRAPRTSAEASAARREGVFEAGDLFLGKYRIERLLGRGGMGEVYLAQHEVLSERYALKVLPLVRAKVAQRRNMLLREARASTKVKHESIVRVVDAGVSEDDLVYLIMEYLDGWAPLTTQLGKPLQVLPGLAIAARVAAGLEACHTIGILHRDLKPDNVMVSPGLEVRLIDFGLAYFRDDKEKITLQGQSGPRFGSILYMAPEQLHGIDSTVTSDMFAFGLVLFEMFAGVHVTQAVLGERAKTIERVQAAYARVRELPRVSAVRPDVPAGLDELVARLLSFDMALRPSAPDARREVQRIGKELRTAPAPEADTNPLPSPTPSAVPAVSPEPMAATEPLPHGPAGLPLLARSEAPAGTGGVNGASPGGLRPGGPRGTVRMVPFRDSLHEPRAALSSSPGPGPVAVHAAGSPAPPPAHGRPSWPEDQRSSGPEILPRELAGSTGGTRSPEPAWRGPLVAVGIAFIVALVTVITVLVLRPAAFGRSERDAASPKGASP